MMQRLKNRDIAQGERPVNFIKETDEEEKSDEDGEQLLSRVDGEGNRPFYMEKRICGK